MFREVALIFDERLIAVFSKKREVLNYLLWLEEKKLCIANTCAQIKIAESRSKLKMDKAKRDSIIHAAADMFAAAAIEVRIGQLKSSAEKHRLEQEASRRKEIESLVEEVDIDEGGETRAG